MRFQDQAVLAAVLAAGPGGTRAVRADMRPAGHAPRGIRADALRPGEIGARTADGRRADRTGADGTGADGGRPVPGGIGKPEAATPAAVRAAVRAAGRAGVPVEAAGARASA